MKRSFFVTSILAAFVLGMATLRVFYPGAAANAASVNPSNGYTIHIDAQKHFGDAHPLEIAHHWCKPVRGLVAECLQ